MRTTKPETPFEHWNEKVDDGLGVDVGKWRILILINSKGADDARNDQTIDRRTSTLPSLVTSLGIYHFQTQAAPIEIKIQYTSSGEQWRQVETSDPTANTINKSSSSSSTSVWEFVHVCSCARSLSGCELLRAKQSVQCPVYFWADQ